jgi:type II secretory pathway pseudopilin PulG
MPPRAAERRRQVAGRIPAGRRDAATGFTLIELAIVLFVITLLLGGVLTPLGQQIAERQAGETRRAMETARTALVGYAIGHGGEQGRGHLPCPDMRAAGSAGIANDGQEDRLGDGRCAVLAGNLPWLTLGLAESDAWGNRLGYAVAADWGSREDQTAVPAATRLQICSDMACAQPMPVAAVLVSHGRNGLGAANASGRTNLAPAGQEEIENADGDGRFVMRLPRAADRPGGEFDDIVLPLSADWLLGRLCDPASRCAAGPR